jgi:hypothetical protein
MCKHSVSAHINTSLIVLHQSPPNTFAACEFVSSPHKIPQGPKVQTGHPVWSWMFHPLSSLSCRLVGWWGDYSIWQQKCSSGSSNWGPQDVSALESHLPTLQEFLRWSRLGYEFLISNDIQVWVGVFGFIPFVQRTEKIYCNPSPPPQTPSIGHLQLHENCQNH